MLSPLARYAMTAFPVRKSTAQKDAFHAWLLPELEKLGYAPRIEEGRNMVRCRNIVVGDPDRADVLLTAHYDTCAVLPFPNFITPRNVPVFLIYQVLVAVVLLLPVLLLELLLNRIGASPLVSLLLVYALLLFLLWAMMAGKANKSNVNDNTSGVMMLLELAQALPEEMRDRVCLVWFDNEEKGLLGSSLFAKKHPHAKKEALVLNFDCVSDGDFLHLFPGKAVKKDPAAMAALEQAFTGRGEKTCALVRGVGMYPSDQKNFRRGVGVCALNKAPLIGCYMDRIHTGRDVIMEEENLELLRDGTLRHLKTIFPAQDMCSKE